MTAYDRLIPIEGTSNVRCVGAYLTPDGRRVRRGLVYRSANLDALSAEGRARFDRLGLGTIVDFRGVNEAAAAPEFAPGVRVHAPIEPTVADELRRRRETRPLDPDVAREVMEQTYRWYALEQHGAFAKVFHRLLEEGDKPLLFHCAAGKDRTGVAAALLLSLLGVPRDVVVEDYMLSNAHYVPKALTISEFPDEVRAAIVKVQPSFLNAALDTIEGRWGGVDRYLEDTMNIGPRERMALAASLTEPA
ncbi:MAG: tyrosine-protein phosphatase [Reyranellaceae bacterium]